MTASGYYRTAFSRENSTTGGRGVIFTFRPDDLTSAGVGVLSETYYYLRGASASIPDGNADLSVTSVSLNESSVSAGDVVDVNATVSNLGSSDVISSFTVSFYIDGRAFGSVLLPNLSNGASTNVSFAWTVLPGTHVIKVVADPVGIVHESNEANNGKELTVVDVAGPDLIIEAVSMQPASSEDGNFIDLTVRVANVGTVDTGQEIEVMVLNGTRGLGSVFIQGIAKGKNVTVMLVVLGLISTANMTVYADWGNRVMETNETNNTFSLDGGFGPPIG